MRLRDIARELLHYQYEKNLSVRWNATFLWKCKFVDVVRNSKFVVTDSFHGAVFFNIILTCEFYCICQSRTEKCRQAFLIAA